nr:DUF6314 family protein [uncultured Halomonas sp.]
MTVQPVDLVATARIVQLKARLSSISSLTFHSRSGTGSTCGWSGEGQGSVVVACHADDSVTFTETGYFQLDSRSTDTGTASPRSLPFQNVFRWRPCHDRVDLSHERRGYEAAVWLFDLVAADHEQGCDLISREAHRCGNDRYRARLTFMDQGFDLEWTIQGPRKDEHLYYRYR